MKNRFTVTCGVALLNVFFLANAQSQDTALAKVDSKRNVTTNQHQQKNNFDAAAASANTPAEKAIEFSVEKFVVPFDQSEKKRSLLNSKVGPNGEELMMEKKSYYYIDDRGKKVRVKSSELKDKPKHS